MPVPRPSARRAGRKGFTLIEVIVALGLFALIATAGFALLRGVLDVQDGTQARLDRLSEMQRAMLVIGGDLDQVSGRIEGDATRVVFQRTDAAGRPAVVAYGLEDGQVVRRLAGPLGERRQVLLTRVDGATWSYRLGGLGWAPVTPSATPSAGLAASPGPIPGEAPPEPPAVVAVGLELRLAAPGGPTADLRRIFLTPEIAP